MSPEQALGDRDLDARTDVYSLGAMLFEMIAGHPPFTAATAQGMVAKVISEPPASLTAERSTVPEHVSAAVRTALEKLPADRFPTARAFSDALINPGFTALASTRSTRARPAAQRATWRERWAVPALVLAGLLALVTTVNCERSCGEIGQGGTAVEPPEGHFSTALKRDTYSDSTYGRGLVA